jgi:hypothetical protein
MDIGGMNIVGFSLLNNNSGVPTLSPVIKLKIGRNITDDGQSVDAVVKQLFAKTKV